MRSAWVATLLLLTSLAQATSYSYPSLQGSTGASGSPGPAGAPGATGANGATGQGSTGASGQTGVTGALGITGPTGGAPTGVLLADGTVPLTANWNAGPFSATFNSVQVGSSQYTINQVSELINATAPISTNVTWTNPTANMTITGNNLSQTVTAISFDSASSVQTISAGNGLISMNAPNPAQTGAVYTIECLTYNPLTPGAAAGFYQCDFGWAIQPDAGGYAFVMENNTRIVSFSPNPGDILSQGPSGLDWIWQINGVTVHTHSNATFSYPLVGTGTVFQGGTLTNGVLMTTGINVPFGLPGVQSATGQFLTATNSSGQSAWVSPPIGITGGTGSSGASGSSGATGNTGASGMTGATGAGPYSLVSQGNNAATGTGTSLNSWYTPDSTWNITVTAGTWRLVLFGEANANLSGTGEALLYGGIATSATAGTGILQSAFCGGVSTVANISDAACHVEVLYVASGSTTFYPQVYIAAFSGTPTINVQWRNNSGPANVGLFFAEQVK